jgi:hypothetical protein
MAACRWPFPQTMTSQVMACGQRTICPPAQALTRQFSQRASTRPQPSEPGRLAKHDLSAITGIGAQSADAREPIADRGHEPTQAGQVQRDARPKRQEIRRRTYRSPKGNSRRSGRSGPPAFSIRRTPPSAQPRLSCGSMEPCRRLSPRRRERRSNASWSVRSVRGAVPEDSATIRSPTAATSFLPCAIPCKTSC